MTTVNPASALEAWFATGGRAGRMFELSHVMSASMPVYHQHVPYSLALHRRHRDPHPRPRADGSSFANEIIVTSGHSGTHIDALGHFSLCGCFHGGLRIEDVETRDGLNQLDAAEIPPIVRPAILLDVAGARGVDVLAPAEAVTAADLEAALARSGARIAPGDAVFVRTGWTRHWSDPDMFIGRKGGGLPGPDEVATRWLLDKGASLLGSDTPGFECLPNPGRSVHAMLLVDHGVHIIENLNLEDLAAEKVARALFLALPLRLAGSTGSPIRPIALA